MKYIFSVLTIALLFSGCSKNDSTSCNYDACAIVAPAAEIQAVKDYLTTQNITNAVQHCSGLFYVIDNQGTGKKPDACSYVSVNYKGSLTNGTVFGNGAFQTGLDGVITGWRNGVPQINAGGRIRLYIPPTLGYGSQPNGPIPANSILIFEIDLNSVQ